MAARTQTKTTASRASVFAILSDPWRYADWVVGAKEVRWADQEWPAVGARFGHTLGAGPIEVRDHTQVEAVTSCEHLLLRANFRPAGEASVDLRLEERNGCTQIIMREWPVAGPANKLRGLLLDTATHARNVVALRRLRRLAERTPSVLKRGRP